MILFHGTSEKNIKNIKKVGLLASTTDQWILEITNQKVCCFSKRPVSGEGGNPLFFARSKDQDGYIVVVDIPQTILMEKKLLTAFDNKILDDYVQKHFFIRQEFRKIGYDLFLAFQEYKSRDSKLTRISEQIEKRPANEQDTIIYTPQDQREYYKDLYDPGERSMVKVLGIECSDELWNFIQYIGFGMPFWRFLSAHFEKISPASWASFQKKFETYSHADFWKIFYQSFPIQPTEEKEKHWQDWFSPLWLKTRQLLSSQDKSNELWLMGHKMADFGKNCQLLAGNMEPEYILGCIHISTPSRILPEFLYQTKSGIVQAIWDKVEKMKVKK